MVTSPDGTKLKLTGDTPPTDQELDEIFKSVKSQTIKPKSPISKAADFGSKLIDIPSQVSYGAQETMGMEPKETPFPEPRTGLGDAAKLIGKGIGFVAPTPGMGGLENSIAPVLGAAGKRILQTGPVLKGTNLLKKAVKPVSGAIGDVLASVGEALSTAPKEDLIHATTKEASGSSIFKGSFDPKKTFRDIGNRATQALNAIGGESAKNVRSEAKALSEIKEPVDLSDTFDMINSLKKESKRGRLDMLKPKDHELIDKVSNELLDLHTDPENIGVMANELHVIKKDIDNMVTWNQNNVDMPTPQGEYVLKNIRDNINKKLRELSEGYAQANDESTYIQGLRDVVKRKLNSQNLANNIENIVNSPDKSLSDAIKTLDELAPDTHKFWQDLLDAKARSNLDKVMPGRGGGSGSEQGYGNLVRAGLIKLTGGKLAPLFSPKGNALLMRVGVNTPKQTKKLIGKSEVFIPGISRAVMGSGSEDNQGGQ